MKYIKEYNHFDDINDIKNTIDDILYDIRDENISYKFVESNNRISIDFFGSESGFFVMSITENIRRVISYLESNGFDLTECKRLSRGISYRLPIHLINSEGYLESRLNLDSRNSGFSLYFGK